MIRNKPDAPVVTTIPSPVVQESVWDRLVFSTTYRQRTVPVSANPRCVGGADGGGKKPSRGTTRAARQQAKSATFLTLYHSTAAQHLPLIMEHGLNRGDVPVRRSLTPTEACFNNAVWLTENPRPQVQRWAAIGGSLALKTRYRLTVRVPAGDGNLWRWRDLANYLGVERDWYDTLNHGGGGGAHHWWVYCNQPIPPEGIVAVTEFPTV